MASFSSSSISFFGCELLLLLVESHRDDAAVAEKEGTTTNAFTDDADDAGRTTP